MLVVFALVLATSTHLSHGVARNARPGAVLAPAATATAASSNAIGGVQSAAWQPPVPTQADYDVLNDLIANNQVPWPHGAHQSGG